ncbi:MAG: rRNA maturation RNase YbeY [Candidatus Uhrbacteria bacterium]|nr:rRNA maturation RNase YbeY [Candidatus Uhrbacteria bacterium]
MITFDVEQDLVPAEHRLTDVRLASIAHEVASRVSGADRGTIGVSFVHDDEIQRLNRLYRQKDKVTDVLSFAGDFVDQTGHLGDVIIDFDQAVRQADGDIELELTDLLVHGVLHVLGYDHEVPTDAAEMFPLQDAIVARVL